MRELVFERKMKLQFQCQVESVDVSTPDPLLVHYQNTQQIEDVKHIDVTSSSLNYIKFMQQGKFERAIFCIGDEALVSMPGRVSSHSTPDPFLAHYQKTRQIEDVNHVAVNVNSLNVCKIHAVGQI